MAISVGVLGFYCSAVSFAEELTAGVVVTKMEAEDRFPFVTGIVEGLAYERYQRDGKATAGMKCIYEWGFNAENVVKIYDAFKAFPDYTPAAVVSAMAEKECPR
ncbi:hypothetical protein JP75_20460 [Devosia riboflavina]|uniref:Rap1a immunity protein domain-containing protein n=1 Tax=Devosia riboflavina TaxID=46914 RepID=A0A087LY42_9HYPH|nr:hypothetical protein [Devosia riboflavina]KFL29545.1 hypothetical protein JP75_20460 [Devosia riboflavina]